jgi:serine protein kinase
MKILEQWQNQIHKEQQILSFDQYLNMMEKNPKLFVRHSSQYLKDMFDYFGQNADGTFKIFTKKHPQAPVVQGQSRTQNEIYQSLQNFLEDGYNSRFLLLIGPNGSAKSSLVKKIMLAAEEYSLFDEGALYSFSWIFPLDQYTKGPLGLGGGKGRETSGESFAHLEDREIAAILPSELKDHPILLIPQNIRQQVIEKMFEGDKKRLAAIKRSYLYLGDLSQRNKMIFDALSKSYRGDYKEVLKHIRVERFFLNKRYSSGAVTIEPQLHVDANLSQITMDRRLASLPASLQSLNLYSITGEVVLANRGLLEFSDLFKRPLDTFKYLLTTMESKTINLHGILTELDIFFIGTSNELHFAAFKQHPDFNSFRGRFSFLKVPYLLNAKQEQDIYGEQLDLLKERTRFEPHAMEALCLWSVMTRLRRPIANNYSDKKSGEIFCKLNPLEKALYLSNGTIPDRFENKEKQQIRKDRQELVSEFDNDTLYEGKFGISPREVKQIIYDLSNNNTSVNFTDVLEYLKALHDKKSEYDFLNISAQGDYHNPQRFIELIHNYTYDLYDLEVRDSLGLVDSRSYEEYLERYIMHITALLKGEKIKNNITGKFEASDMYFIEEVEQNLNIKESAKDFRSHMISRVGAYSLDNPGKKIEYTHIFSDIVKNLQESYRNEQKKIIDKLTKQLVIILDEHSNPKGNNGVNEEATITFEKIIHNLKQKYGYSEQGALSMLRALIHERY